MSHPKRRIALLVIAMAPPKTATKSRSPWANARPKPRPASRERAISSRRPGAISKLFQYLLSRHQRGERHRDRGCDRDRRSHLFRVAGRPATLALLGGPAPPPRRSADNPAALPSRRDFFRG